MIWAVQSLCDMRNIPSLPHADLSIESAVNGVLCVCVGGGGGGVNAWSGPILLIILFKNQ